MKRVEATALRQAEEVLGEGGEGEFTFLLVPVAVYEIISQRSRKEGCSVGEVFQRAIMQYLQAAVEREQPIDEDAQRPEAPSRAVIVKRGR